jgi:hypothetical protein
MRRHRRTFKLAAFAFLAIAVAGGFWLYGMFGGETVPASGGSNLSVQLPDNAHFQQDDPRWSAMRMGGPAGDRLGPAGCAVSSVAMAMTNLGHPFDPGQLTTALNADNGFTTRSWLVWDAVPRTVKGALRVDIHERPSLDKLDACLARGDYPVVKFYLYGVVPHWVVLVGKHQGTYYMRDPLIDETDPVPLTRRTSVIHSVRCIGRASPGTT